MRKMNAGFASHMDTNFYSYVTGIPTSDGGYMACRSGTKPFNVSVTGTVIRAHCLQKTDGSAKLFAATATKIYELTDATTWTDRSSGGGSYTTASDWNFCQFGDQTIATSIENDTQSATTGAFGALSGSPPKAKFCATQNLAVILAHYNDGTLYTDGWWASDVGDATTWTPSSSNDAANGRLLQTPGPITGICAFKGRTYLFKENSFYSLEYVGAPIYYQVTVVDLSRGASFQSAILNIGDGIIFANKSGFFIFDGNSTRQISDGTKTVLNAGNLSVAGGNYFDQKNSVAYFGGGGSSVYAYNVNVDAWGAAGSIYATRTIVYGTEAAINADLPSTATALLYPATLETNTTNSDLYVHGTTGTAVTVVTNVHGNPRTMTTWLRLTPVARHYYQNISSGQFSVYKSANVSFNSALMSSLLYDASPVTSTFSFSNGKTVRWDFSTTNRWAQFYFMLAQASGTGVDMILYDYVLTENPAGTD